MAFLFPEECDIHSLPDTLEVVLGDLAQPYQQGIWAFAVIHASDVPAIADQKIMHVFVAQNAPLAGLDPPHVPFQFIICARQCGHIVARKQPPSAVAERLVDMNGHLVIGFVHRRPIWGQ